MLQGGRRGIGTSITSILPPLQSSTGRSDVSTQLVQSLQNRTQRKAQERAQERLAEGKNGGIDQREAKFRWLVVRNTSTPNWG